MQLPAGQMTDSELRNEVSVHKTALRDTHLTESVKSLLAAQLQALEAEVVRRREQRAASGS